MIALLQQIVTEISSDSSPGKVAASIALVNTHWNGLRFCTPPHRKRKECASDTADTRELRQPA
jgi:hypothetical protein